MAYDSSHRRHPLASIQYGGVGMDTLFHNCLSASLSAAQEIHIAMCNIGDDFAAQKSLNTALHNVLIIAEQCRQAHAKPKPIAIETEE